MPMAAPHEMQQPQGPADAAATNITCGQQQNSSTCNTEYAVAMIAEIYTQQELNGYADH